MGLSGCGPEVQRQTSCNQSCDAAMKKSRLGRAVSARPWRLLAGTLGSLPYEKPTIIMHWVDTAYPELPDVAITHVTAALSMWGMVSVSTPAEAIKWFARAVRVAPMTMSTRGRTG
jgi:hypothetical protein